jgi:molybdenum cofactor cytidylyltransferase
MLAAVILAAGESRRMGSPKALLPYRGSTFLEHLLEVTRHPSIGWRRVIVGAHAPEIARAVRLVRDELVNNTEWEKGQLSSIRAALHSLPPGETDGILLCPVDHPLVSAELVAALIEAFYKTASKIVVPRYKQKRGHPMIFSSALYDELLAAPQDVGARSVVWAHATEVLEIPTEEEGVVLNLNDPDTLARAQRQT